MKLFVGLGNPGRKHAGNRHNVGFMVLDRIASDHGFGSWAGKFQGAMSSGQLGGGKVMLLKPETFVNRSGQSVGEAARYFRVDCSDVVVFHDELDLVPGKIRIKRGGGHAGHNGLKSIERHIGPDFWRVRIGIGHPGHKELVAGYVLKGFAMQERGLLDALLAGISNGAGALASGDRSAFHGSINSATAGLRDDSPATERTIPTHGERTGTGEGAGNSVLRKLAEIFRR